MVVTEICAVGSSVVGLWLVTRWIVSRRWGHCTFNANVVGKVILITGGNSGIGFETAKYLASVGAQVIIAARDDVKNAEAVQKIVEANRGNSNFGDISWMHIDLNSFDSVRNFAAQFIDQHPQLNIVIHNAGVYDPPYQINADGLEMQMTVNHFGNALLTHLLKSTLSGNGSPHDPSKVILVNSALYKNGDVKDCYFG
jgi:NAD(P)-dependent dehydrogenase (short-subunit alcohol dehydrogenase family)